MTINYSVVIALAAMMFDSLYGAFAKRYWRNRFVWYNTDQLDHEIIESVVERAIIIDSHYRFLGWWTISVLGTIVKAHSSQAWQVSLLLLLMVLLPLWIFFFVLPYTDISGFKRQIPLVARIVGYGASLVLALVFRG